MPAKHVTLNLSGESKAPLTKDPYAFSFLQPPNVNNKRYDTALGYDQYVKDYLLYVNTIKDLKTSAKAEAQDSKKFTTSLETNVTATPASVTYHVTSDNGGNTEIFTVQDPTNPVRLESGTPGGWIVSFDPALLSKNNDSISLSGHFLRQQPGSFTNDGATLYLASAVEANLKTEYTVKREPRVPKPPKAKKVRTPEEQQTLDEKKDAQKKAAAWRREQNAALAKAKLEEKLASSLAARSAAIRRADPSVETTADLENGWRVVTHKKPHFVKTKTTTKNRGTVVVKQELVRS